LHVGIDDKLVDVRDPVGVVNVSHDGVDGSREAATLTGWMFKLRAWKSTLSWRLVALAAMARAVSRMSTVAVAGSETAVGARNMAEAKSHCKVLKLWSKGQWSKKDRLSADQTSLPNMRAVRLAFSLW
jgi:hypothetical protein